MIGKLIILLFIISAVAGYFGVSIYLDVTVELPDKDAEETPDQNNTANNTTNMSYYSGAIYEGHQVLL